MESALGASHRSGRETAPDVLPVSQYLQERLQERRARNTRPKRLRQSDFGPRRGRDDDIFITEAEESKHAAARMFDSSPMTAAGPRHGADNDGGRRRALGAKVLDEHMDRLTKENFALKLELDHRRDHTAKLQERIEGMQAQVERAEQLQDEHAELLRINSQLVEELEKRDKAVEEAMDIICDLEDKVVDIEERHSVTRPSTANADSGYAGTETQEQAPPSSPPEPSKAPKTPQMAQAQPAPAASAATNRLSNIVDGKTPARTRREPSVLSQKKQSTHALRSVYLEATQSLHPVKSFNSLLTRQESRTDDGDGLNSPRLSVLSESSFPSMYSPKKPFSPDKYAWEAEHEESFQAASSHLRQDSIKRVSQWMDERELSDETPSKSNKITSPLSQPTDILIPSSPLKRAAADGQYRSLGDALSAASGTANQPSTEQIQSVQYIRPFTIRTDRQMSKSPRPTSFGGPIFGEPLLPPTPDSASTRMLRASRSSIADERSILDTTPAAVKGFDPLEPGIRTAPRQMRSSVELNSAYESYIQRRNDPVQRDFPEDEGDARSETIRDLSMDYDGFPDGGSILMGTPSRFLKHGNPPIPTFPAALPNPPSNPTRRSTLTRRLSSSEATASPHKPSLSRAETSPTIRRSQPRIVAGGYPSYAGSITSPRSHHSGSSSNKTVVQTDERELPTELYRTESYPPTNMPSPPRLRASPSPARTFSQKAQGLLRRMSNTQKESYSDREKSSLPTLTSAPSSAYVYDVPREMKRPGTSHGGNETPIQVLRRPASRDGKSEGKRPSLQTRTNTAPPVPARPLSASITDRIPVESERKNIFKRSNGAKQAPETPTHDGTTISQEGSGVRGAISKRRGSIKDVVTSAARLPWR